MSTELLRLTDDLWCLWSNSTDGPIVWGNRDEVHSYMADNDHVCKICGHSEVDERFGRALANGTSAIWRREVPSGFIYNQQGWLPWERIPAFLDTFDESTLQFDTSLLDAFEASR